jgi:hypothetical protein
MQYSVNVNINYFFIIYIFFAQGYKIYLFGLFSFLYNLMDQVDIPLFEKMLKLFIHQNINFAIKA